MEKVATEDEGRTRIPEQVLLTGQMLGLLGHTLLVDPTVTPGNDTCRSVLHRERDQRHDRGRTSSGDIDVRERNVVGVELLGARARPGASVGDLGHRPSVGQDLTHDGG